MKKTHHPQQFKLCKPLFPSAFIASTFWYRVVKTWNALPANIVSATSLAMFKARLNGLDLSKFAVQNWYFCAVCFYIILGYK